MRVSFGLGDQILPESIQLLLPELVVLSDPAGNFGKRSHAQLIDPGGAGLSNRDQTRASQNGQVLTKSGLRRLDATLAQRLHQIGDTLITVAQPVQNRATGRIRNRMEYAVIGRSPAHRGNYISDC